MLSEWENIKECNKNLRAILNIRGRGGQLMMPLNTFGTLELLFPISNSFLFCSNSQKR